MYKKYLNVEKGLKCIKRIKMYKKGCYYSNDNVK